MRRFRPLAQGPYSFAWAAMQASQSLPALPSLNLSAVKSEESPEDLDALQEHLERENQLLRRELEKEQKDLGLFWSSFSLPICHF